MAIDHTSLRLFYQKFILPSDTFTDTDTDITDTDITMGVRSDITDTMASDAGSTTGNSSGGSIKRPYFLQVVLSIEPYTHKFMEILGIFPESAPVCQGKFGQPQIVSGEEIIGKISSLIRSHITEIFRDWGY